MLGIKDIFSILDSQDMTVKSETVLLKNAVGRILINPVISTIDSPPFDKAAMDGWAVRGGDEKGPWELAETIAAGEIASRALRPGKCTAIMTGAKIPRGCGKIIRIEYTRQDEKTVFLETKEPLQNIIFKGENIKTGERVLEPRRLTPGDIGILASLGRTEIEVAQMPRIGIITTGSELTEPGEILEVGEIFNSNGPQLMAQAEAAGCPAQYYGITIDDERLLYDTISKALKENYILLLSGGVSMGQFDFVPGTLEKLGVKKNFHKAAIKPGRPIWFGRNETCFVFGLPGNPVSTYILFEVFVKHLIYKYCSLDYRPYSLRAVLGKTIKRKTSDRSEFLPVQFKDERIYPVSYNGSSHLNAMSEADGLIILEQGVEKVIEGETVHVRLL
ncbi:molybdopterin molybdotransferase MoeA [Oceanispirochaeta sp.]|jgi:molybdopterin molybdotransferase|uniref:molybdopterin molybdotransferase MoeA n=1 Tax=Oceanispirochaeta sp. TaxID=2035350 RepID=UPI00260CED49|nr:molybdopterin molybdotransferase MoeA [Oceanispirochaeta sp.]MDA3958129.1 molybdopterin molybdotransferase MoeA [Oceanispirochaeta sp.]